VPVDPKIITDAANVAPKQAIDDLEAKGVRVTATAAETQAAVEEGLFAITRSVNMQFVQDVKDELLKSLEAGIPFEDFKKNILGILEKRGWTGDRTFRFKTIYRNALQGSLNRGRFKRQTENKNARPYLMLIDGIFGSDRSRKTHRSRSGSIQHINAKFWKSPNSWYPLNGHNCTGRTRSLTTAQAKARGIKVKGHGKPDPGFGKEPLGKFKVNDSDFDSDIVAASKKMKPSKLQ